MNNTERVVTHRTVAGVARLMGYTPQGISDLLETCLVKKAPLLISAGTPHLTEWIVIGTTRPAFNKPIDRVSARYNFRTKKFEFSTGPEAHALTADMKEQQRIREELAEKIARRVRETQPVISERFIKENLDPQPVSATETIMDPSSSERAPDKIISPVAPRDPRGLNGAQRGLSGPGKGKSEG